MKLTEKEKKVIEALWQNQGDRALAMTELSISEKTMEGHLTSVYKKLGLKLKKKNLLGLFFRLGKI